MDQILANNTNAETGTCPAPAPAVRRRNVPIPIVECYAEFLPTADYVGDVLAGNNAPPSLDFRFTARDLDPEAGGYAFDDVKLALDKTAGPFLVTSRNAGHRLRRPSQAAPSRSVDRRQHDGTGAEREDLAVHRRRGDLPLRPRGEHAQRRHREDHVAERRDQTTPG